MTQSLASYLTTVQADADAIQQAARYVLAESTGDMPVERMRSEIAVAVGESETAAAIRQLAANNAFLTDVALLVLSLEWQEADGPNRVRGAIEEAQVKMPVLEALIVATVAMYGLYLHHTRGRRRIVRITRFQPDGTYEEIDIETMQPPPGPLTGVVDIFRKIGGARPSQIPSSEDDQALPPPNDN